MRRKTKNFSDKRDNLIVKHARKPLSERLSAILKIYTKKRQFVVDTPKNG